MMSWEEQPFERVPVDFSDLKLPFLQSQQFIKKDSAIRLYRYDMFGFSQWAECAIVVTDVINNQLKVHIAEFETEDEMIEWLKKESPLDLVVFTSILSA